MITGLHSFLRTGGNKDLLMTEGNTLWYLNGAVWNALDTGFTSDLDINMVTCPLNDKVYIDNGTDYCHSWDRASVATNSCLTDMGAAIPYGKVRVWHKNHMFVLNGYTVSGVTSYNRVGWSAMGDPDTFNTGTDFIDLPGGGDLVAAGDLGDALVFFKAHSLMFLTGWGDTDWTVTASASNVSNIDESVGIAGKRALTRVGNELWFMDDEGQIRRLYQTDFDAFRKDIVSTKIQTTLSGLNKTQLEKVAMWTHNDKVYISVPNASSSYNNLVLVYDIIASKRTGEEAWTTYTGWNISCFAAYPTSTTPDLYLGDSNADLVYKHYGYNDNGSAIDSRWDGKEDEYDKGERWKRYKFGYISGEATESIDVEVHASVDGASFANLGGLNLASTGTALGPTGPATMGPTGTWILGGNTESDFKYYFSSGGGEVSGKSVKMSIRHNAADEAPTVNTFTNHFKQRQLR